MGNLTKSALLEFNDVFEDGDTQEIENLGNKKHSPNKKCSWAIYDANGDEICRVKTQQEAIATRAEFRKIDKKESGSKKKYTIKKVN